MALRQDDIGGSPKGVRTSLRTNFEPFELGCSHTPLTPRTSAKGFELPLWAGFTLPTLKEIRGDFKWNQSMNSITIKPFSATYLCIDEEGARTWEPCEVVGIMLGNIPKFVVIAPSDDGCLYPFEVDKVKADV